MSTDPPPSMAGTEGFPRKAAIEAFASTRTEIADKPELRRLARSFVIPARSARAFKLAAGEIVRVSCSEGPQVADLIVFNADDPAEKFWSGRTRVIHGGHLEVGDHLWSVPPRVRPMLTLIADTLEHPPHPFGARSHDLLYCRCDGRMYEMVYGRVGAPNCNDNLVEAIAPFGLGPEQVHDPFNIFMTTGLNERGKPFYLPSDAKKGDYVELLANIGCLLAISACPGGSSGSRSLSLTIEIFCRRSNAERF
jgi:uncharacterized protein YcgI (DUF1989 family)